MGVRVAVAGASGYTGGELLRLVLGHPELALTQAAAGAQAGAPVAAVHPHLAAALPDATFVSTGEVAWDEADLAFLALPHGESAALVAELPASCVVVDLGADFRLSDAAAWQRFYGSPHAGTWAYGLPELPGARAGLAAATRIANPGCYATAVTLALAPLHAAGVVAPADNVVVAASGTTGAGRAPRPSLLASEVMGNMSVYKVGGSHQHTPEIVQNLSAAAGTAVAVSFTPMLAPLPRGILATCTAPLAPGADAVAVRAALAAAYDSEPFVRLLPQGRWPCTAATLGSNAVHLQVAVDLSVGRAVVVVAEDNLGKGAAGQAVQNANLALGLPETTGLTAIGVKP